METGFFLSSSLPWLIDIYLTCDSVWARRMFAAFTLVFICLSVTALADHHQPCQTPNMTGELAVTNTNKGAYTVGDYVYDSGAKRLRFKVKESFNSTVDLDVLLFFEEGVFYEIDSNTQSCKKKTMQPALNPLQLPSNAKFITKMQLGRASVQDEGINLNVWMATAPELKAPYFPSVTMGCLPVSTMYTSDSTTLLISNINVEVEIKDPDLLILPSFCEGATLEATPEGTVNSFFHFFL